MADELQIDEHPQLERPVLIAAFRGWNDGGQGASLAGAYLARAWAAQEFARIDAENFYDFQATRPMVSLVDGYTRRIEWPENTFLHAPLPGGGRDAIILLGVEPNLRWRSFSAHVSGLAKDLGVELVVTLGSLLADVPHYVSLTPSPRAAKALVDRLAELLEADVDTAELDEAADSYQQQVSEAVASDEETLAYVQELERRVDELAEEADLPSGDAIAAELTRFLRDRENGGDGDVAREQ